MHGGKVNWIKVARLFEVLTFTSGLSRDGGLRNIATALYITPFLLAIPVINASCASIAYQLALGSVGCLELRDTPQGIAPQAEVMKILGFCTEPQSCLVHIVAGHASKEKDLLSQLLAWKFCVLSL